MKPIQHLLFLLLSALTAFGANKPNIIYILADDLGYGDLGCYGSKLNSTPNIDRMAKEGIKFTDFHAAAWCAPSRIALMTGVHPNRPGLLGRNSKRLGERVTVAEMLKDKGYATSLIGKWHMGMGEGAHPLDQGFDYWYGTRGSNDWDGPAPNYEAFRSAPEEAWKTPVYKNRENQGVCPQSEFTGRYTRETIELIKRQKDQPFFIYLAHNMPHVPVFASKKFQGKSQNGVYGDTLLEIDWSVGEILKALKEHDLEKNTLVVFTSDNGPWSMFTPFGGVAGLLNGEKSTTWEGGERVPAIFYWPGTLQPKVSQEFVVNIDVYATIAKLTSSCIKEGEAIDSIDFSETLLHGTPSQRTRHLYFFRQPMAYRSGDYKIHFLTRSRTREPETGKKEPSIPHDPPLLFNLRKDIGEQHNIAAKHPDLVKKLTTEFKAASTAVKKWEPYDW